MPPGVAIVDANDAVARQVVKVNSKILDESVGLPERPAKYSFYVTKQPEQFQEVAQKLLGDMLVSVKISLQ